MNKNVTSFAKIMKMKYVIILYYIVIIAYSIYNLFYGYV